MNHADRVLSIVPVTKRIHGAEVPVMLLAAGAAPCDLRCCSCRRTIKAGETCSRDHVMHRDWCSRCWTVKP